MSKPYYSFFKYNIAVREQPNTGSTWFIYEDFLNKGIEDPIHIDHIEFDCNMFTVEKFYEGLGFGIIAEGRVTYDYDEINGNKYAVIKRIEDET